ncbi:tetratricopeptide repeat protein [Methylacidimicrobium tartarophylax]|uniref:TPR repeat-containing protein YrrB n=1 Tax=Methylacidimicrobium tartarophylax TaxID=1041768 RepID=A0A5E6MBA1_9BACT|nr:tetratricopeptide repeat protein [Methylacidimicrobium tartarophylax]VVM06250.1 TPR repeat-containing protein YrrB [Methylacidimicrobium tartarophylax]
MRLSLRGSLACLLLAIAQPAQPAHAAYPPQDQFLQAYLSLQEAEQMEKKGEGAAAHQKYLDVERKLELLKRNHPDWEPSIVAFRLRYVRGKIALSEDARKKGSSSPEAPQPDKNELASSPSAGEGTKDNPRSHSVPATRGDAESTESNGNRQLFLLRSRISQLESELTSTKSQLQAAVSEAGSLRERLQSVRKELAIAQSSNVEERIATVLQENNALKAQLAQTEGKIRALQTGNNEAAVVGIRDQLKGVQEQLAVLERENQIFRSTASSLQSQLETAQQRLAESARHFFASSGNEQLKKENEILRGIVNRQLQEQARREMAKKLVTEELQSLKVDSQFVQRQLEILSSPLVSLSPEELALLKGPAVAPQDGGDKQAFVAALKQKAQQMGLFSQSSAPDRTSASESGPANPAKADPTPSAPETTAASSDTVASENHPAVQFASQMPASSGETSSEPASAPQQNAPPPASDSGAQGNNAASLSPEIRRLAEQAAGYFNEQRHDEAAKVYDQILQKDPGNVFAWANLGVVRFQQSRYDEAEKALQQAIKLNPNDAFSHSVLGIVYYQQGRYDNSISMLTRSIVLDPNDPRTRNYLGIACSKKGWQEAAEKELRRALELNPNYADAHFNLAVIYATQKPPAKELAKRHYQDALNLGLPKDVGLEKFLE